MTEATIRQSASLGQQDLHVLRPQQGNGFAVEGGKCLAIEPLSTLRDHAICKITACIQHGKPRFNSRPIDGNILAAGQQSKSVSNLCGCKPVCPPHDPAKLAQSHHRHRYQFSTFEQVLGNPGLFRIIRGDGTHQDIGIGSNLHGSPAHPLAITSFISSIEMTRSPSLFSKPKASEILPLGRSAATSIRPLGNFCTVIFDPGRIPKCWSRSLLRVIWPLLVTVSVVMAYILSSPVKVMQKRLTIKILVVLFAVPWIAPVSARPITRADAARAAIHPVHDAAQMQAWLARVPVTRDFPPDFAETLSSAASLNVIEMTTAPGCHPCADLWARLGKFRARYRWQVRIIGRDEAMLRSGRLGLPWVGDPVAWVRPIGDERRAIPMAIGTDHLVNLARNVYLATKMLSGVRPDVGLRAMAKYTGIVTVAARSPQGRP